MYNSLNRCQNVFGFFTTVAFVVAMVIALSDLTFPREPNAFVKPMNVQVVKGRPHYYTSKKEEYAIIKFSMDADLSSLFTWNTKQLFVYITAEWEDAQTGQVNEAVIWDDIITAPSADHLSNKGPATMKKLRKNTKGPVDKTRYGFFFLFFFFFKPLSWGFWETVLLHVLLTEHIICRGQLHIKNQRPKYQISHPSGKMAETTAVKLRVNYNVQPWVGLLTWNQFSDYGLWKAMSGGVSKLFDLPTLQNKKH